MSARKTRNWAAAALACLGLLGCSSDDAPNDLRQLGVAVLETVTPSRGASGDGGATVTEAQVARALAGAEDGVALVGIEDRSSQSLVIEIEENRGYRTFATATRQTITYRRGMVTATRGLGGDLMSSDTDALLRLVSARAEGQAVYVMRFLSGEEKTVSLIATCTVARAGTGPVQAGEINTTAQIMTAKCSGGTESFVNAYLVDSTGTILSTRQWLGPLVGYLTSQMLRR